MRQVLLDTNAYSAFKRKDTRIIEILENVDYIGLDVTVLAELYSGFKGGSKEKRNRRELEAFIDTARVELIEHNKETSEFYSIIYMKLKAKGTPIPTNDIWIAATAMQSGLALLTLDNHFSNIDGLIVYDI